MGGALAVQFALYRPELSDGVIVAASNSGPGKHEKPEKHEGGIKGSSLSYSLAGVRHRP